MLLPMTELLGTGGLIGRAIDWLYDGCARLGSVAGVTNSLIPDPFCATLCSTLGGITNGALLIAGIPAVLIAGGGIRFWLWCAIEPGFTIDG